MNIYLVSRTDSYGWDEYDSFVVIAHSEEEAKLIDPSVRHYCNEENIIELSNERKLNHYFWTNPDNIRVTYLGTHDTDKVHIPTIVCASYNAG